MLGLKDGPKSLFLTTVKSVITTTCIKKASFVSKVCLCCFGVLQRFYSKLDINALPACMSDPNYLL